MNKPANSNKQSTAGALLSPDTADRRRKDGWFYLFADWLAALMSWAIFFTIRRIKEGGSLSLEIFQDPNFYSGALLIPFGWILFYALFDEYRDIYRLSRLTTFARTLLFTFFGVLFLFFTVILDDTVTSYRAYYRSFFVLLLLHFSLTVISRMILLTRASRRLKEGVVAFNTLIVGGGPLA